MPGASWTIRIIRRHHSRYWYWREAALVAAFSLLVGTTQVAATWPEQGPTESVRGTVTELLYILKGLKGPSHSEERRWEIEQVIRRRVNYEDMARRSLGAPWVELSDSARHEYVGLFVQLLRDALANRMVEYSGEHIIYSLGTTGARVCGGQDKAGRGQGRYLDRLPTGESRREMAGI